MKKNEMIENLKKDIMWRKEPMIRNIESELEHINKYLEELKKSETVSDVINNARILNDYAASLAHHAELDYNSINESRLGLYYLHCIEEAEKE